MSFWDYTNVLLGEALIKTQTQMRSLSPFWFGFTMRHSFGAQSQLIFYRKGKSCFYSEQ